MNIETLFTEQRWNILSVLSKGDFSPLQLAEKSNTTMANISQQLRLLEVSNLVTKQKIPNRDKGKPRSLFSLSDDYTYLVSAMKGFAEKKLVKLDKFHKILFRVFYLENIESQYYIEKFLWNIEEYIKEIDVIALKIEDDTIKVVIGSKNHKKIEKIKDTIIKKRNGSTKIFKIETYSIENIEKYTKQKKGFFSDIKNINFLYDHLMIFAKLKNTDEKKT
jgi:DNA-binding HxlR family transcriptional regulator